MNFKIIGLVILFIKCSCSAPIDELDDGNTFVPKPDTRTMKDSNSNDPLVIRNAIKLEKYLNNFLPSKSEIDQAKIRAILRKTEAIKNERLKKLKNKINEIRSRKGFEQNEKMKSAVAFIQSFIDVISRESNVKPKYVHRVHQLPNTTNIPASIQRKNFTETNQNESISNDTIDSDKESIQVIESNEDLDTESESKETENDNDLQAEIGSDKNDIVSSIETKHNVNGLSKIEVNEQNEADHQDNDSSNLNFIAENQSPSELNQFTSNENFQNEQSNTSESEVLDLENSNIPSNLVPLF